MISTLLRLVVNIAVGFFAILALLSYFDFTSNFPDAYLYGAMFVWLCFGTVVSKYHFKDHSMIGAWVNPLSLITAPMGVGILLFAALFSTPYVNEETGLHLMWVVAPSLVISWVLLYGHMHITKKKLPFILEVLTVSHIQLFLIFSGFAYLYLDQRSPLIMYEPKTTAHYIFTGMMMIASWGLTALYISILRSFDFYQVREHLLSSLSTLDFETRKIIATHEAGHCLCYAFFKTPPQAINIYLYEKAMVRMDGAMGLVEAAVPKLNSKEFDEWNLLTLLAGQRAELAIHRKTSQGASDDVAKWKSHAHEFLTKYDRKYHNQPENDAQMAINAEKERELFNRHTKILDDFFSTNKSVLKDLSAKAYRFNPLEVHHIHPYLAKTKITKGFPVQEKKGLFN